MLEEDDRRAATALAVRCGVLKQCPDCKETWDGEGFDAEDEETMEVLVERASAIAEDDPELDVFNDDAALRNALVYVLENAPLEKPCSH